MRLIVAGSRSLILDLLYPNLATTVTTVICGCAPGIDDAGFRWARRHDIPVEFHPAWRSHADWAQSVAKPEEIIMPDLSQYGRAAGVFRNRQMLLSPADTLLAIWDGKSPGTSNMINLAKRNNVPVIMQQIGNTV